jgi:excisionase family DNA binding protein
MPRLPWRAVTAPDTTGKVVAHLEPLLSINEVAKVLRISESSVYRLVRSGELVRVKVGGRTLFEPEAVRRLIAGSRDVNGHAVAPAPIEEASQHA